MAASTAAVAPPTTAWPRHAGGRAPVEWGGVRHGGAAPLRRDCPRQLEGAPHLGRRPGRRDPADPRGGLLSLVAPIPPATVSCHAKWPPAGGKPADHPYRFSIRPARRSVSYTHLRAHETRHDL